LCNRVAIIKEGSIIDIQDIKTLQKNNYKKVQITAEGMDETRFNLDGVSNIQKIDGMISFFYKGDINTITRLISSEKIADLTVEDLTLEEIFMHYYE